MVIVSVGFLSSGAQSETPVLLKRVTTRASHDCTRNALPRGGVRERVVAMTVEFANCPVAIERIGPERARSPQCGSDGDRSHS
ncbi:hypothetical protein IRJ41_001935 [Triplophysa rosa]|uniref:Uncharacterized protein n=1 Tax=Triplophysa rosa TaxID=992332 RepID=A0A9W8C0M1_TRIRA|nr:hypothetical protein IRJ41_001935 [Triplophysa rosa]